MSATDTTELCCLAFRGEAHDTAANYLRWICEKQFTVEVVPTEGEPFTATALGIETDEASGEYVIRLGVWVGDEGPRGGSRKMNIYSEIDRLEVY
jgi:hypothetical protein